MVFVDPYALRVDWETPKPLASTRVLDVWYLPKSAAVIAVGAGSLAERSSARARECLAAPLDRLSMGMLIALLRPANCISRICRAFDG